MYEAVAGHYLAAKQRVAVFEELRDPANFERYELLVVWVRTNTHTHVLMLTPTLARSLTHALTHSQV